MPAQGLNEKFTALLIVLLAAIAFAVLSSSTPMHAAASVPPDQVPNTLAPVDTTGDTTDTTTDTRSPLATNDFLPEDQDLTVCVGALERPGCGSEERGGWRQALTFGAVVAGLVVVFGTVIRSTRRRNPAP